MKTAATSLSTRIRLAVLKGMARLLAWLLTPALKPATVNIPRTARHRGRIIDGEFRRVDERSATTRW